jgi:WD40 repeat protein
MTQAMKYKAFISYSHTHRAELAAALEAALHRFGIPEHEPTGLHLFRDSTNLSASPELWPDIQRALNDAEYFILLASPEAAASTWVQQEVAHWREHHGAARMILALADGEIRWAADDFDFATTTALPRTISGAFSTVPFWVDFRRVKASQYDVCHPAFCDGIATIAARLHGKGKDELVGIYVANRISAEAERLAAEAELALRDELPQRSVLLSCTALKSTFERGLPRLPAAEATLRSALSRFGGRPLGNVRTNVDSPPAAFSADGRWLATIGTDGDARLWSLAVDGADTAPVVLRDKAPLQKLMFTQNPRWLITAAEPAQALEIPATRLRLWDAKTDFANWHDLAGTDDATVTCSIVNKEGSHIAAQFGDTGVKVWQVPDMDGADDPSLAAEIPAGPVAALAFIKDPLRLVTGASDGLVRIWRLDGSAADRRKPLADLQAGGAIEQLAVSPTGNVLAVRARGKPPQLWRLDADDIASSRVELQTGDTHFFHVHFSPKGSWLLCIGDASFALPVENVDPEARAFVLTATGGRVWKHSFSDDERWLVTATGLLSYEELAQAIEPEYAIRLWDLGRGKPWRLAGHNDIVTDVAFTPDGTRVISCSLDRSVRIWNCATARKFQNARLANRSAGDASNAGEAPGGLDQHEDEHVTRSFSNPAVLLAADDQIFHCLPSPDGLWLLTISRGASHAARLWFMLGDPWPAAPLFLATEQANVTLALPHPQRWLLFSELARASELRTGFSKTERWFFLQSGEASVRVYDLATNGVKTIDLKGAGSKMTWAGWSPDERWFVATSETSQRSFFEVRLWDLLKDEGAEPAGTAIETTHAVPPLLFSADSRWLLGLQNETALLWDLNRPVPLGGPLEVPGSRAAVVTAFKRDVRMAFSPDGRWLINAANADGVWLHDLRLLDPLKPTVVLSVADTSIETVCADEQGRFVFAGGTHDFARLWRFSEQGGVDVFMELRGHECVERAVFSGDGRWLITRDFSAIRLWDLEARECRSVIMKQDGDVRLGLAVAFLANDRWAVISKWKAVILIDLATAESAASPVTLPGHAFENVGFWFTPDHRWLVTADFPFETLRGRVVVPAVQIWDLLSSHPEETAVLLPGLETGVKRINISSDGRWLCTTSDDGVRLWPLGIAHLLAIAKTTVGREFSEEERRRYRIA